MAVFIPILAIGLLCGVIPVTAIISNAYLKGLKLRAQQNNGFYEEDLQELRRLAAENDALRQRIENLEAIVVEKDANMLQGLREVDSAPKTQIKQQKISYRDTEIDF